MKLLKQFLNVIIFSYLCFFVELMLYQIFKDEVLKQMWILIPICIYTILIFGKKAFFENSSTIHIEMSVLISLVPMYLLITWDDFRKQLEKIFDQLSLAAGIALFLGILLFVNLKKCKKNENTNKTDKSDLFNLFYLNTPKAHEIAMLIDNKIMKTIEQEQVSEKILKKDTSMSIGKKDVYSGDLGYSLEESTKKRVYENFDVKNTKSIMLRKIYDSVHNNNQTKLKEGQLVLFKNIELRQRNIDDTLMILNVLQDSKMKNQGNDDLEINMNKMMDKMLDDFTIDYIFEYKGENSEVQKFIIQLPYKSMENFENGYQHNDLQLGKLSLLGIYRGEIEFSKRESISSKFLGLLAESVNAQQGIEKNGEMKLSFCEVKQDGIQFDFEHQRLKDTLCLLDIIAIIQEININEEE